MRRSLAQVLAVVATALALTACGDKSVTVTDSSGNTTTKTVKNVHFAKTKFLLHAGLAFGAVHRYIVNPYQAGAFKSGADGKVKALVKAAAASAFAYHELGKARQAAESDDTLRNHVIQPLDNLLAKIKDLPSKLKGGNFSPADITGADDALTTLKSAAGSAGANITDRNAPIPGG